MNQAAQALASGDLVLGDDGLARCRWGASAPDYLGYHDGEWGRRVEGDDRMYERLTLEAFQSGLAWITILRKRPAFREAFANFDPEAVVPDDRAARCGGRRGARCGGRFVIRGVGGRAHDGTGP